MLGDLDGDSDLDIFITAWLGNRVWLNGGTGTFSNNGQTLGDTFGWRTALGDVDGDGDLDALTGNGGGVPNILWLNDGTGHFNDSGQPLGNDYTFAVALGDVDGDGDLDAFDGNHRSDKVWLNQNPRYADLTLAKSVTPASVMPGQPVTYTLTFANVGTITATNVVISDIVPFSFTVSSVVSSGARITDTGDSPPYVWNVQDLPVGTGGVITVTGIVSAGLDIGDSFVNTAIITCTTTDNDITNNISSALLNITGPHIQFSATNYGVGKGAGTATITVTLSIASGFTTTVDYSTGDGTATAGEDYVSTSGMLTFSPGVTRQNFGVTITEDSLDEDDETLTLTLYNPGNATIAGTNPATLTIVDNELAPTVQFDAANYDVDEGAGTAVITLTLSAASGLTTTVGYATGDGTAMAGEDYVSTNGTLTFPPGVTRQSFDLTITEDLLDEDDETLTLTLNNPVNAIITGTNPATLSIVDNDLAPTVQFDAANYDVDEGAGTAMITVTLSAASGFTTTVDYATDDGTATVGEDYVSTSGTLTFFPGVTRQNFGVIITEDLLDENDEILTLTLNNPVNATITGTNPAMLTIFDNDLDLTPTVQFDAANYSVNEGAGTATITVTLSAVSGLTITVDYATGNGTATAGEDYVSTGGTLTFFPGVTHQVFGVNIVDDANEEQNETIHLALGNPTNASLGTPNSATLTILERRIRRVYLPVVLHNYTRAPDLIVTRIVATSDDVQVVIENQGNAPVTNEFWVDVYIDPDPAPTTVNQVWYDGRSDQGLVWGVDDSALPLNSGDTLTLTIGDVYYSEYYSAFTGTLPAGTPVYAQVDSVNLNTTYGGVLETHEIRGETYNNVKGPIFSTSTSSNATSVETAVKSLANNRQPVRSHKLPLR
jgi:uncharacterized repeat protein (TIGR01451 family)